MHRHPTMISPRLRPRVLALLTALSCSSIALADTPPPALERSIVETGHTALWHAPERDGEGWVLEILDDQRAVIAWFTYDEAGNQRWLYSLGDIVDNAETGQSIVFSELRASQGGRFGEDFDPEAVQSEVVGSLSLRFEDCNRGQLDYSAYGQAESFPIQRLIRTMAAGCSPIHGVTGEPIHPLAGQSGHWFDPSRNGEGLQLIWAAQGQATLSWYTYDNTGNPYWLIGLGQREGEGEDERIVFDTLYTTRGGRFGEDFDPALVERLPWGRLELAIGCDAGIATFESDLPEFGNGSRNLILLTRAVPAACPWVPPKFSDLYELKLTALDSSSEGDEAQAIAEDGAIFISRPANSTGSTVQLLKAAPDGSLEQLSDASNPIPRSALRFPPIKASPDGQWAVFNDYRGTATPESPRYPLIWEHAHESIPLVIPAFNLVRMIGASADVSHVVGRAAVDEDMLITIVTDLSGNFRVLPPGETTRNEIPIAVSNDGQRVAGSGAPRSFDGPSITPTPYTSLLVGLIWEGDAPPNVLRDSKGNVLSAARQISADGRILFGDNAYVRPESQPASPGPWYWISPTHSAYLATLSATEETPRDRYIGGVSADGNIVIGTSTYAFNTLSNRAEAFVWTQNTGLVSIKTALAETAIPQSPFLGESAVAISASGDKIVLNYLGRPPGIAHVPSIVTLTLTPKPQRDPRVPLAPQD